MTLSELYIANPDVSTREEGFDGAILFNPDTDDVLVINATGLIVWEALAEPCTKKKVAEFLEARCNNAPGEHITDHITAFMKRLIERGFVSLYKEET